MYNIIHGRKQKNAYNLNRHIETAKRKK